MANPVVTNPVCLLRSTRLELVRAPYEEPVGGGKGAYLFQKARRGVVERHAGAAGGHHNECLLSGKGDA